MITKVLSGSARLFILRFFLVLGVFCLYFATGGQVYAQQSGSSDRFIIKLKDAVVLGSTPTVRRLEKEGDFLYEVLGRNGVDAKWLRAGSLGSHVMQFDTDVRPTDYQALLNRMQSDPEVEFVFVDKPIETMVSPNDASFASQWALRSTVNEAGARFDQAWDLFKGSATTVVAVVDTGIVFNTADLEGRLLSGYDFISDVATANDGDARDSDPSDPGDWVTAGDAATADFTGCSVSNSSWHGTFIAAQIAANTNNSFRVAGADWNTKVLPVRVSGKCRAFSSDLFDGMLWAAGVSVPGVPDNMTVAQVINVSLGANTSCSGFAQSVMNQIESRGVVVAVAAGNGGGDAYMPANCNNVLSVGALDKTAPALFTAPLAVRSI
ncbi:MAG: S8 family serine peptidase [Limnobacter sp.]|nr:S8 family serine peptidase [Limnobacter sp.]